MFDFFSLSRLIANCLDCLSVGICALFGCVLCGAATAAPGQLDSTFGAGGIVIDATAHSSAIGLAITLQSDGKILVAGGCTDGLVTKFCVSRYLPSGSLDEARAKALFARFGVPGAREKIVATTTQAEAAARETGGRVVLKILSAEI